MKARAYCEVWAVSILLLAAGCAGDGSVYTAFPTEGVELVDYEGELKPERVNDKAPDDLIRRRADEGYRLVGRSDFTVAGNLDMTGAMVRKGREVKAGKIDYLRTFDKTASGAALQGGVQMPASSTDPRMAVGGADMTDLTTGSSIIEHYGYRVYYFKQLKR